MASARKDTCLHLFCLELEKPLINIVEYVLCEHHVDVVFYDALVTPTVVAVVPFTKLT